MQRTGGSWVEGTPATALSLPVGVTAEQVTGLRFTFTRADGAIWENPSAPVQQVDLQVQRRTELRTGGPVLSDLTGNAAADAFKMICLGANGVIIGKILIQLLGCVGNEHGRCNACNTGKCPTGICTQDPRLVKRLDVDRGAQNIVDYMLAFDSELRKLLAPVGNSSLPVGRSDALVTTDKAVADKLDIQYAC